MRFRIRYKDQIVGALSIFGIAVLVFLIFIIGSNNRWFKKDLLYKTELNSASGLAKNMAVSYKGFKIGSIKDFNLTEDANADADARVKVVIAIYDEYCKYVREGSVVELVVSPIGLGNQFVFYPGRGTEQLPEYSFIPVKDSKAAKDLGGLSNIPETSDSILLLIARANSVLDNVNAAIEGNEASTLGRTFLEVEDVLHSLKASLANIETLSAKLDAGDNSVYKSVESSLNSVSGILANIDKTAAYLPGDMPELSVVLSELRQGLLSAQDVLTALSNNPLLKGGIPERVHTQSNGTNPRDVQF
ncbi:MAG: MlaD family protein [Spirochaetaceae bacterium]|nr:MlaD family protein [Spirochaetaceae bacterium]